MMWGRKRKDENSQNTSNQNAQPNQNNRPKKPDEVLVNNQNFEEQREEYNRKIRVLSQCLEEKAEENITLYDKINKAEEKLQEYEKQVEQAKELELLVSELNTMLRQKDIEQEKLREKLLLRERTNQQLTELNEEFQRRIQVLSLCLEEMAQENLEHWNNSGASKNSANSNVSSASDRQKVPSNESATIEVIDGIPNIQLSGVEAKIHELTLKQELQRLFEEKSKLEEDYNKLQADSATFQNKIQSKEKRIVQLNTKLMEAVNKKTSLQESNNLYEQKLKSLEKEMMENLHQEGIRRQEAEYLASKLKKKVAELQFLLDEREQEDISDEDDDDDDDDDDND